MSQLGQQPPVPPKDSKYSGNPCNYITHSRPSVAAYTSLRKPHKSIQVIISNSSSTRLLLGGPYCCLHPFVLCSCSVLGKHLNLTSCISWTRTGKLLGNHQTTPKRTELHWVLRHPYPPYYRAICHFICAVAIALPLGLHSGTLFFTVPSA